MDFQVGGSELRQRAVEAGFRSEIVGAATSDVGGRARQRRGRRGLPSLLLLLILIYGVMVLLNPWAIHIGGQWTPLMLWTGTGKLVTENGTYPLLVTFGPSAHHSKLRLDGLRPTSGMSGWGWLCTPEGKTIVLRLYGTMYDEWRSTDGALTQIRLLERLQNFPSVQAGGYVDLFGHWHGPQLVMEDRNEWSAPFHAGLKIKHASLTLSAGSKADFNAACAAMSNSAQQK